MVSQRNEEIKIDLKIYTCVPSQLDFLMSENKISSVGMKEILNIMEEIGWDEPP